MSEFKWVKKVRVSGNSAIVTIPKEIVEAGGLEKDGVYEFSINDKLLVSNSSKSNSLVTNGVTMGRYFNQSKLIPDPFVPDILHTPQELGLKKKVISSKVTNSTNTLKYNYFIRVTVTEQITIKLNSKKFAPLLKAVEDGMKNYVSKSTSDLVGKCIFYCYICQYEKVAELGFKTRSEFVTESIGITKDEALVKLIGKYNRFVRDNHKLLNKTNSDNIFLK